MLPGSSRRSECRSCRTRLASGTAFHMLQRSCADDCTTTGSFSSLGHSDSRGSDRHQVVQNCPRCALFTIEIGPEELACNFFLSKVSAG